MPALDPTAEARCRTSFARQPAMTTIGATVESVAAGEVELALMTASMMVMDTSTGLRD